MDEARKSSGIPRPLPLIRYREREREGGGSNGGAKLSPKMLPLGSNNSYIKSVSNLSAGKPKSDFTTLHAFLIKIQNKT